MDVNRILLDILIVLVAAKLAAEAADRLRLPAVVGEIAAGVLIGPSVFGLVEVSAPLQVLAELGVILLLLQVGLEMDLGELGAVGRASLSVAVVGVVVPLVAGFVAGVALGFDAKEAVFVGAALTATSVGITARVFGDLRALATVEARTVLGAAVADDILGLVILTVVTRVATQGSVSAAGIAAVMGIALGFVVLATLVGVRLAPPFFALVRRHSRSSGTLVAVALAFALAVAELANAARLAPIVGAFVAGLVLARSPAAERVRGELTPVAHLLVPVFFLQIGIDADVTEFGRPRVLGIAGVLLLIAVAGKLVSAAGLLGRPGDRLLVGIGMIPRGEVGLIFATLGLRNRVFGADVYAALLLVVLVTTVATPPALRWRLLRVRRQHARQLASRHDAVAAAAGESLVSVDDRGEVVVVGQPAAAGVLAAALAAARLCELHPPGPSLLEWLEALPLGPRRWDDDARAELWRLLGEGGPRSWRLLRASGVLQQAMPELDDALGRRAGGIELDPLAALAFPRLVAVRDELGRAHGALQPEAVLLAALVLDACSDASSAPMVVARRTAARLGLDARLEQRVAGLVNDAGLLDAAARRVDALEPAQVASIAVHVGSSEQLRALYVLTRATFAGETWERDRLEVLHSLAQELVTHDAATEPGTGDEVERRKRAACAGVDDREVRERILAAPREYVLGRTRDELVRHARLCEPTPERRDVRVAVHRDADGCQYVELACRDRIGLIAAVTGVLAEFDATVQEAVAATWGDGTALSSYRVECASLLVAAELAQSLRRALATPLESPGVDDAVLTFDDHGSPWYTRCTFEATDRRGLLHALATALAGAGVNVHAARITTDGARAVDALDVTRRDGSKLDETTKARVVELLRSGTAARARRRLGGGAGLTRGRPYESPSR